MIEFLTANRELIGQVLGFLAMGTAIISYQFRSRKIVVLVLTLSSVFWCLHFFALSSFSGLAMNGVNVVRGLCYAEKGKAKWASHKALPFIFALIIIGLCIWTWEGINTLLPLSGMLVSTYSNWQTDSRKLKLLSIPSSLVWGVYDFLAHSVAGTLNEVFVLCSIALFFLRDRKATGKTADITDNKATDKTDSTTDKTESKAETKATTDK